MNGKRREGGNPPPPPLPFEVMKVRPWSLDHRAFGTNGSRCHHPHGPPAAGGSMAVLRVQCVAAASVSVTVQLCIAHHFCELQSHDPRPLPLQCSRRWCQEGEPSPSPPHLLCQSGWLAISQTPAPSGAPS